MNVSFHVWSHHQDRRTPDLRARYHSIEEQARALRVEREFSERVRKNIAQRAVASAERLTQNVVQFARNFR